MREWLVKISYELLMNPERAMDPSKILEDHNLPIQNKYLKSSLESLINNALQIDEAIDANLDGRAPDRLYRLDRAILRVAFNEILFTKLAPISVSINESVEIAKKYSSESSYKFINGVLSGLVKGKVEEE